MIYEFSLSRVSETRAATSYDVGVAFYKKKEREDKKKDEKDIELYNSL